MVNKILSIVFLFSISSLIVAREDVQFLPNTIVELRKYYDSIHILEQRSIINKQQADDERRICLEHGTKLVNREKLLTAEEFLNWNKRETFVSLSNVLGVLAGITVVLAIGFLGSIFLIPILIHIPATVWEIIVQATSFILMFIFKNNWLNFIGCLTFLGALPFTLNLHFSPNPNNRNHNLGLSMSWILFVVWSLVALIQQVREPAYLATFALESALGFVLIKQSLSTSIGFQSEDKVPTATITSFVLILIGSFLHLQSRFDTPFNIFTRPFLFTGTFVYSIGMIILSSIYYDSSRKELYWPLQLITFVSGLAAILFGPLFEIPFLESVGGTMLVLWLLEKYVEFMPWKNSVIAAFNLLLFGLFLYLIAFLFKSHPEYFIFSSKF